MTVKTIIQNNCAKLNPDDFKLLVQLETWWKEWHTLKKSLKLEITETNFMISMYASKMKRTDL